MSKKAIGNLYITSIIVGIVGTLLLLSDIWDVLRLQPHFEHLDQNEIIGLFVMSIPPVVAGVLGMMAWIGALINVGKAQEWIWFLLLLFFGGIVLLIYLVAGPQPLHARSSQQTQRPQVPLLAPQVYQPPQPVSALEILQQRYARGEIDAATFEQMRDRLKA